MKDSLWRVIGLSRRCLFVRRRRLRDGNSLGARTIAVAAVPCDPSPPEVQVFERRVFKSLLSADLRPEFAALLLLSQVGEFHRRLPDNISTFFGHGGVSKDLITKDTKDTKRRSDS
jgi:hypothetical protein